MRKLHAWLPNCMANVWKGNTLRHYKNARDVEEWCMKHSPINNAPFFNNLTIYLLSVYPQSVVPGH